MNKEELKKEFIKWYENERCAFKALEPYLIFDWWMSKIDKELKFEKEDNLTNDIKKFFDSTWFDANDKEKYKYLNKFFDLFLLNSPANQQVYYYETIKPLSDYILHNEKRFDMLMDYLKLKIEKEEIIPERIVKKK